MALVLHAADLHLGAPCPVAADAPDWVAVALRDASLKAFESLVEFVESRGVRICLFAGDIHHDTRPALSAKLAWRDGLTRLHEAGALSFVVRGNHDPLGAQPGNGALPPSVVEFPAGRANTSTVRADGETISISGVSYSRRHEPADLASLIADTCSTRSPSDDGFRIGLLHANLEGVDRDGVHGNYAPCSQARLEAASIDYWALGHVHRPTVLQLSGCWAVYPGCLQGRHPGKGETGARGAMIFEVHDSHLVGQPEPVELAAVRFDRARLDISEIDDSTDLADALVDLSAQAVAASGSPTVLRIALTGRGLLDGLPAGELDDLREAAHRPGAVWIEHIHDRTGTAIDLADREGGGDFIASALRAVSTTDPADLLDSLPTTASELVGPAEWPEILEEARRTVHVALDGNPTAGRRSAAGAGGE